MNTRQKWTKLIMVALLVATACFATTDLVFAGIDYRTYSDQHLGITNPNNMVKNTNVTDLSKNVCASILVNFD